MNQQIFFPFFYRIFLLIFLFTTSVISPQENGLKRNFYKIPVICYHHVSDKSEQGFNVTIAEFTKQLEYLSQNGYQPLSLDEFYKAVHGENTASITGKPVLLTFDDGSRSVFTNAFPLLKKYKFKSTMFIYPSIIENKKHPKYMKWSDLRTMVASGLVDIGSHALYHPRLVDMNENEIKEQLVESARILNKKLGVKVRDIAYPFGLYDERVLKLMKETGYRMGFTINPGNNTNGDNLYTLQRVLIRTSDSIKRFASFLNIATIEKIKIFPSDSSIVQTGNSFYIDFLETPPEKLKIAINGKKISLKQYKNRFSGRFPSFQKRKILTMRLDAVYKQKNHSRQIMYILKKS